MVRPPRSMPPHITASITAMTTSIAMEPLIMLYLYPFEADVNSGV